jgi:hypothetical protein
MENPFWAALAAIRDCFLIVALFIWIWRNK